MTENTQETQNSQGAQTPQGDEETRKQQVITSKSSKEKKKLPLFIGIAALLVIGIIAVLSLTVLGGGSKTKKAMAQLELGNKYLDEMDFERAEAAYKAALQIDPKNVDAYLRLIDLYEKNVDAEKLAKVYRGAKKEFTGSTATDEAKLEKVKENAANAIEKLVKEAVSAEDYEKAAKYVEDLAKEDSAKAAALKVQIAEAERKAREEAERKAKLAAELEGGGTGEVITFGHYEQDNDTTNGMEPIEWVVLKKEADRMLVVSRYALDCQPYNTERQDVTWEVCTLRTG